jgi:hypothetical protein
VIPKVSIEIEHKVLTTSVNVFELEEGSPVYLVMVPVRVMLYVPAFESSIVLIVSFSVVIGGPSWY